jgi:putative ABC transport system permease protein
MMHDWKRYVKERVPRMPVPTAREAEILEELADLLEDTYEDQRAAGASPDEAFARAAAQLPEGEALARWITEAVRPVAARVPASLRSEQVEERLLRSRRGRLMNSFLQDVKYALRMLAKHPGYTALAVVALGLGIGANTAIFSMSYALLEKPVAVPEVKGLCAIDEYRLNTPGINIGVSPAAFADWKEQSQSFSGWAVSQYYNTNISGTGTPERVQGFRVSANFFQVLNARPLFGRTFLAGEDTPGRERVAVIAYRLWERRFGADPGLVGQVVRLEGQPYEIVGVMPREFDFPVAAELWMPMALTPQERQQRAGRSVDAIARMKPGVTLRQASAEMAGIAARLAKAYPNENKGWATRVMDIREKIAGNLTREYMTLLMGAVAFVLLIACANVANLQLARATGRYREVALRVALGASRWRVMRQLITESVLQSLLAVGLGLVFAYWSLELVRANFPPDVLKYVPGISIMGLDWATFLFSFSIALLAGILAGLMPALLVSRPNLNDSLRDGARGAGAGRGRHLTRSLLVVAEVALALVLLVGAGLMVHGVGAIRTMHNASHPETLLTFQVNLPDAKYREMPPRIQFYDRVLERLRMLPGVEQAALGRSVPYNDSSSSGALSLEGRPALEGETRIAQYQFVNDGWFRVLQIPLREGRIFEYEDGLEAPRVAVISEKLARQCWPGESPLGRRVKLGNDASENPWLTVVGVVEDIRYKWPDLSPSPAIYIPYRQTARQIMQFALRLPANPLAAAEAARKQVAAVDPDMPIFDVKTHAQVIHESVTGITYVAVMMSVLGLIALALASVGLYGVMAYAVTERTHEIGVRMALGAQRRDVMRLMLARGMILTAVGLAIGLGLSYALANMLSNLIVGVSATDVVTFGGVVGLLAFTAFAAIYIPARRATCVDPLIALRYE